MLALTGKQPATEQAVPALVADAQASGVRGIAHDRHERTDTGHGRIEVRRWWTIHEPEHRADLTAELRWPGLRSSGMIDAARTIGPTTSREVRSVSSSLAGDAEHVAGAVRSHCGIENGRHWVLDIACQEDDCRAPGTEPRTSPCCASSRSLSCARNARPQAGSTGNG